MDKPAPTLAVLNTELPRDKAANAVLAQFAKFTEDMTTLVDRMSGFYVVAFDDEGNPYTTMHFGDYFPMPVLMVPEVIEQCCVQDVYGGRNND